MMCDIVVVQSAEIIQAKYFISNIKNHSEDQWKLGQCLSVLHINIQSVA